MGERFTFAVVGHNEAETLEVSLGYAFAAADAGDDVWFVDSTSTDDSATVARSLGAQVVAAPRGKGRAMQAAVDRCSDGYLCFLDADYSWSEHNIPALVRQSASDSGADMVVGFYSEPLRRLVTTPGIYYPLVGALFPEAVGSVNVALSGFRAVRRSAITSTLPPGYGAETHLNLSMAIAGATVANSAVGEFRGKLRGYSNTNAIAADVSATILDLAFADGRLAGAARPAWESWLAPVLALIARQPPPGADDAEFLDELAQLAARPLPSAR